MFLIRTAFWLGLALLVIQPQGVDLAGSAGQIGSAAVETGRSVALDSLDQVTCDSFECAGIKLVARSALAERQPTGEIVSGAPYPAPPLIRRNS
jgi:hypothetical protein